MSNKNNNAPSPHPSSRVIGKDIEEGITLKYHLPQNFLSLIRDNLGDIILHPKDYVYAIMTGAMNDTYADDRSMYDVADSIKNKDEYVKRRFTNNRDLSSLYIYGNDLGLFEEAPELRNVGVEYDNYLRSIGRDPNKIKTYKGKISNKIILPEELKEILPEYINSKFNKTYGALLLYYDDDNVAGFLLRLVMLNGIPLVVNSDLWDFEPNSYTNTWSAPYWKSWALNKVGTPFILKDIHPVEFIPLEDFYDDYYDDLEHITMENSRKIAEGFGYLRPVTITFNKSTNKNDIEIPSNKQGSKLIPRKRYLK